MEKLPRSERTPARGAFTAPRESLDRSAERLEDSHTAGGDIEANERIEGKSKKALGRIAQVGSLLALAMAGAGLNYERTRYEIHEKHTEQGVTYEHPDAETTLILNYMLGKEQLPTAQRLYFERLRVLQWYSNRMLTPPENLDQMDEEHLRATYIQAHIDANHDEKLSLGGMESDEDTLETAKIAFDSAVPKYEYDQRLYNAVWKLQEKTGAPKIRWADPHASPLAALTSEMAGKHRAFYDPLNNTVYLPPSYPSEELAAEDAHALQFNEHPIASYGKLASGWVHAVSGALKEHESLKAAYQKEYMNPGTLEYEAHHDIEKKLIKETVAETEDPH